MQKASTTPTLDYMLEIQEQSQICGEFLEWLQTKYAMFRLDESRETAFYQGAGDYICIEKVLAEFFDVNKEQAEKEKQTLIESLQKNKTNNTQKESTT